jgi:predicted dithiol-disulfide oxidoreductase (DUF899 family)
MTDHRVVKSEEWETERARLIEREKELTRAADEVTRLRQGLPWVAIDQDYRFDMDGLLPHLHARDLTLAFVSRAPIEKLRAYRERMGWSIPWVSSANSDFSFDMGASATVEQVREQMPPEEQLEPIARQNADASGVDVVDYIAEIPSTSVFRLEDGAVYRTYATTFRGVEFLMPYYPILDRAPKGRDENGDFQTWIRRHDEYA